MGSLSGGTTAESGVATVGLILLILLGLVAVGFGGYFGYTNGPVREMLLEFLGKNVLYMPNVLFGYGFISDIFNNTGYHYSIASITALFGMVINRAIGGVVVGGIASGVSFVSDKINQARSQVSKAATATASADIELAAMPKRDPVVDSLQLPDIPPLDIPPPPPPPSPQGGGAIPCSLPGFEWLENTIAPQGIVMSMTILWYLMIELWDTGSGGQSAALGVTTAIVFIVQWLVLAKNGCLTNYTYTVYSPLIALVMAITFAGTSYGIQKAIGFNSGSSSGGMNGPITGGVNTKFICPSGTGLSPDGSTCIPLPGFGGGGEQRVPVGGKNQQSQPVNDQDQFVCEAYKDGELVTSTIVD
jgi:hypothetical protein